MGGKDPKKESKKDSGSSGRLKDKGKSSSFGGGHSSKGREKERERERGTKYNQAYNDQTVTVQSSSSRKGKEKGTTGYETSAPEASNLAPIFESYGTGGQFDNAELQFDQGDDLLGAPPLQSGQAFLSSAPETAGVAFRSYYTPQENYSYENPSTANYAGTAGITVPSGSTSNALGYGTSATVDELANTLGNTGLSGTYGYASRSPNAQYSRLNYDTGTSYNTEPSQNYEAAAIVSSGMGRTPVSTFPRTPRAAAQRGGRRNQANSKGTYQDIQREGNRSAQPQLGAKDLKKYHSRYFQIGQIVKLFWFEPGGNNGRQENGLNPSVTTDGGGTLRQQVGPGKMRRFVIIETCKGHSTAIPISTYGFRACSKTGCHPEDHSIIYTGNTVPNLLPADATIPRGAEPYLPNPAVKMKPRRGESLAKESRLNYAKKYTIEHNFNVKFVGEIAPESSDTFWMNLNRVRWQYQQPTTVGGFPEDAGSADGPTDTQDIAYQE